MGIRDPDRAKRVETRKRKVVISSIKYRTVKDVERDRNRKRMERSEWSDEKKALNREQSKLRMRRMRHGKNLNTKKKTHERVNSYGSLKTKTAEEVKKIKTEQRKQQRKCKKEKKAAMKTQTFKSFSEEISQLANKNIESPKTATKRRGDKVRLVRKKSFKIRKILECSDDETTKAVLSHTMTHLGKRGIEISPITATNENVSDRHAIVSETVASFLAPSKGSEKMQIEILQAIKRKALEKVSNRRMAQLLKISRKRLMHIENIKNRGRKKISQKLQN